MNAIDELKRYWDAKCSRDEKVALIDVINSDMRAIKAGIGDDVVAGGGGGNKLDALIDRKEKLLIEAERLDKFMRYVETKVNDCPERSREVLQIIYMQGLNPSDAIRRISELYYVSEKHGWRMRSKAIEDYEQIFTKFTDGSELGSE